MTFQHTINSRWNDGFKEKIMSKMRTVMFIFIFKFTLYNHLQLLVEGNKYTWTHCWSMIPKQCTSAATVTGTELLIEKKKLQFAIPCCYIYCFFQSTTSNAIVLNLYKGTFIAQPTMTTTTTTPTTSLSIPESFVIAQQGPLTVLNIRLKAKVLANFIDFRNNFNPVSFFF